MGVFRYQCTRFATKHDRYAIVEQSRKADAAICSLEPHDAPVGRLSPASTLTTRSVASRALRALFPNNMPATLAGPAYVKAALSIGFAYGAIFAESLFFASQFCSERLPHLRATRDLKAFFLLSIIVAYKSYSSGAHVVPKRSHTAHRGRQLVVGGAPHFMRPSSARASV